ncbi:hypothetical protein D9757_003114 [Collybiopsis confluens]|uniref:lytic cellulose monooxygenase (C4-dehydrogenating) n=1 Tax=Collybiopsis confluens TaxID=2823264 RepID=A0A8H5ME39_9AGAR|nr:hypothetical protein D9757_003114 [Collybiopsis confluens]
MISSATLLVPILLSSLVSAHGWLNSVNIGSQSFQGNVPNASPAGSIIRQINDVDPVKGSNNPYLACGQNAQLATKVAEAQPGDQVSFFWVNGEKGPWVHNTGPMQTYMAACTGVDSCSSFDASNADWFKIQEQGRISPGGAWTMSLMNSGAPSNVTIPQNIAPGNYLIRHELIALQIAQTQGGAEFYPSCTQVKIGGSGTGAPTNDELVKLPGAYKDTDPGILVDVFSNPNADYIFPGPPVAAFVNGSSSASTSTSTSGAASSSASGTSGSPSKMCKKKKRAVVVDQVAPGHEESYSMIILRIVVNHSRSTTRQTWNVSLTTSVS